MSSAVSERRVAETYDRLVPAVMQKSFTGGHRGEDARPRVPLAESPIAVSVDLILIFFKPCKISTFMHSLLLGKAVKWNSRW